METLFRPMIQESVNKIGKGEFDLVFKVGAIKAKSQAETVVKFFSVFVDFINFILK